MTMMRRNFILRFALLLILPYLMLAVGDSFMHAHSSAHGDEGIASISMPRVAHSVGDQFTHAPKAARQDQDCAACSWARSTVNSPQAIQLHSIATVIASSIDLPVVSYHCDPITDTPSRAPPAG